MLDPLHSSSNIVGAKHEHYTWFTKIVSFRRCTAGPNIVGSYCIHLRTRQLTRTQQLPTMLGVVASVCTKLKGVRVSCIKRYTCYQGYVKTVEEKGAQGPVLESPGNFSGPKSNIQI